MQLKDIHQTIKEASQEVMRGDVAGTVTLGHYQRALDLHWNIVGPKLLEAAGKVSGGLNTSQESQAAWKALRDIITEANEVKT